MHSKLSVPLLAIAIALYASRLPELSGVVFSVSLLILTILLYPHYSLTLAERQSKRLTIYNDKGFIKWFLSGFTLRIFVAISFSVLSGIFLSIFLNELTKFDWVLFILAATGTFTVRNKIVNTSDKEFRYPYSTIRENSWVKKILSCLMAAGSVLALLIMDNSTALSATIFQSNLLQEMMSLSEIFGFFNDYISMQFIGSGKFLLLIVGVFLIFLKYITGYFLLLSITDCLTLPRMILWKTVSGIEFFERHDAGAKHGLTWATAITVFLSLAIWFPVTAQLEYMSSKRLITEQKEPIEKKVTELLNVAVELINGKFYEPGTIEQLEKLESEIQLVYNDATFKELLRDEINVAFSQVERNTDVFLDNYYSLQGEYIRIAKMLSGELDNYLKNELKTALETNDPFQNLSNLISREQQIRAEFFGLRNEQLLSLQALLLENEITPSIQQKPVIMAEKRSRLLDYKLSELMKDPETALPIRLGFSAASGVIVGLVIKKVVAKGTIKVLATAIGKFAAKKAAGAGVGAVVGGTIGSVVPGIGTAILGGVGAVAGTLLVEWGAIELDESVNREEFKNEIILEIRKQKQELLKTL